MGFGTTLKVIGVSGLVAAGVAASVVKSLATSRKDGKK